MAVYHLAKAHRDLGDTTASRHGMQTVTDGDGRLTPAARRGLAHLARLAGDSPTAYTTARTLGWAGRRHRVEGDIHWPHGDMTRAAAYAAARYQAERTASPANAPPARPTAPSSRPSPTPTPPTTKPTSPSNSSPASTCAPPASP